MAGSNSRRTRTSTIAFLLAVAIVAGSQQAQSQSQRRPRLMGVFDDATSEPIAGVEVIDIATGTKAITSVTGTVSLAFLDPGTTVLKVRKVGYAERMFPVVVSPSDTASLTVILKSIVPTLPTVTTKGSATGIGKLAEFERRRAIGVGVFPTREQLERHEDSPLSAVLALAGVKIKHVPASSTTMLAGAYTVSARGRESFVPIPGWGNDCPMAVVVVGTFVFQGAEMPFDINTYLTRDVAAVEFYAGAATVPAEYNGMRIACGLVVIWTKP